MAIEKNILIREKMVTILHNQTTIDQADDSSSDPETDNQ